MVDEETGKAISYLYKMAEVKMPKQYITKMNKVAIFWIEINRGEIAYAFKVIQQIAKELFFSGEKEGVCCHIFFVLDWCLMEHADNVVWAKINPMSI